MNRLKSRQHLGRALDRAGGRRNFRVASNFGSGSLLFCHGFIMCIYIYICICNLWDYLFNLPRQESHFFEAWFHLVWKNDLGRDPVFVQVGQQINRRLIPKVSTSNIHYIIYIHVYVYIYMILYTYMYTCNWYVYNIIYIISLPHIYIYIWYIIIYHIVYWL